ncbi:unnamed protein product [Moneuplotes crassus]|uniref:Uncharacterized protein n=1 Tax=Euplotes crassus TaxID=5936 RepID=A0AAD1U466_EUPCR|nr:unnamed protein product [Moneuplotes crassus]
MFSTNPCVSQVFVREEEVVSAQRESIALIAGFNKVEMDEVYLIDAEEKENNETEGLLRRCGHDGVGKKASDWQEGGKDGEKKVRVGHDLGDFGFYLFLVKVPERMIEVSQYSAIEELKNPIILLNLVCIAGLFCVCCFCYQMVGFYIKYIGGNIYVNTLATCFSEILGNFCASCSQRIIGTKNTFLFFFTMTFMFSLPMIMTRDVVLVAISIFGCKFFLEGAFMVCYYANAEFFPSLFSPFAFSFCGFFSHIIGALAPEVAEVKPGSVPIFVLLVFMMIGVVFTVLLKKRYTSDSEEPDFEKLK